MTEYDIINLGNPSLREKSVPINEEEFGTQNLENLSALLFKAMELETGIGLAAPQIGVNKRIIVFGMKNHAIYGENEVPYTVLCNPSFVPTSEIMEESYEGCLSVKSFRAKVPRYKHIRYQGYDINGNFIEREASDLHARVFQHEYDHLEGIVFIDKVKDFNSMGFHDELVKYNILQTQSE